MSYVTVGRGSVCVYFDASIGNKIVLGTIGVTGLVLTKITSIK